MSVARKTTAELLVQRDQELLSLSSIQKDVATANQQVEDAEAALTVLRARHAETTIRAKAQQAQVSRTLAELAVSQAHDQVLEKARQTETIILEKHRYAQRCWEYLVRHHAKKKKKHLKDRSKPAGDPRFVGTWDLQHPEFSWDDIIARAHESHFNGLMRNEVGALIEYDWEFPSLQSLIDIEKRGKCDSWAYRCDRNGYDLPPTISVQDMESIRKFPNTHSFTIDTYPKDFGFVNHYY